GAAEIRSVVGEDIDVGCNDILSALTGYREGGGQWCVAGVGGDDALSLRLRRKPVQPPHLSTPRTRDRLDCEVGVRAFQLAAGLRRILLNRLERRGGARLQGVAVDLQNCRGRFARHRSKATASDRRAARARWLFAARRPESCRRSTTESVACPADTVTP